MKTEIKKVQVRIEEVEADARATTDREEKKQLREKENKLREEKNKLLDKEKQLREEKINLQKSQTATNVAEGSLPLGLFYLSSLTQSAFPSS